MEERGGGGNNMQKTKNANKQIKNLVTVKAPALGVRAIRLEIKGAAYSPPAALPPAPLKVPHPKI